MPARAALKRIVTYYQSQQFADDLARQIGNDPEKAKLYRQHIVDLVNSSLQIDGIPISDLMAQEQERFVRADMPIADLVDQARYYALRWCLGDGNPG